MCIIIPITRRLKVRTAAVVHRRGGVARSLRLKTEHITIIITIFGLRAVTRAEHTRRGFSQGNILFFFCNNIRNDNDDDDAAIRQNTRNRQHPAPRVCTCCILLLLRYACSTSTTRCALLYYTTGCVYSISIERLRIRIGSRRVRNDDRHAASIRVRFLDPPPPHTKTIII